MTDDGRAPEPWQALRDVAIPPGMRTRVRDGVEGALDRAAFARRRPARRGRWVLAAVAASAVIAAAVAVLVRPPDSRDETTAETVALPPGAPVAPVAPPAPPGPAATTADAGAGTTAPPPRAVLAAAGERVELPLAHGHVSLRGPAAAVVADGQVTLARGAVDVLGRVAVAGPTCTAEVDGTAEVSVRGTALVVRRFAGTVQLTATSVDCQVIEPLAPPPAAPAAPPRVRPPAPTPAPTPPAADPLADAVAAYRAATALEALEPAAALSAWRRWLVRWPDSALAHSVELRVLGVLGRLGRHAEVGERARAFLRRYPDSPRRADVERLVGEAP